MGFAEKSYPGTRLLGNSGDRWGAELKGQGGGLTCKGEMTGVQTVGVAERRRGDPRVWARTGRGDGHCKGLVVGAGWEQTKLGAGWTRRWKC